MIAIIIIGVIFLLLFFLLEKFNTTELSHFFDLSNELNKTDTKFKYQKPKEESTYIGMSKKKKIYVSNRANHIFICGTTGSGKTIAISNYIKSANDYNYPMLIIDGKGDIGSGSLLDIINKFSKERQVYVIDLNNPKTSNKYNPFKNTNPTVIKDMLINMSDWSEQHYKLNTERYLQRVITLLLLNFEDIGFQEIIDYLDTQSFISLSKQLLKEKKITKEEHQKNISLAKISGEIAESSIARFSILLEGELGCIFDKTGIDIYQVLSENAIIVFILNPLMYPEISPLFGNLIIIDSKKAVSKLFFSQSSRIFFIFDEINTFASSSFLNLVNKSRSANITCILATQSLADLEAVENNSFKEQVIENCNNYIILRQNSSKSAEEWANICGTKKSMAVTYEVNEKSNTQKGSIRSTREFLYHPDIIKNLSMGEAIFLSKDNHYHCKLKINKPF